MLKTCCSWIVFVGVLVFSCAAFATEACEINVATVQCTSTPDEYLLHITMNTGVCEHPDNASATFEYKCCPNGTWTTIASDVWPMAYSWDASEVSCDLGTEFLFRLTLNCFNECECQVRSDCQYVTVDCKECP